MGANYQAWSEGSVLAREAGRVLTITLNRPERLKELAAHHLGMGPILPQRIVRLDDLPVRPPEGATEPLPVPDGPKVAGNVRAVPGLTLRASVERAR